MDAYRKELKFIVSDATLIDAKCRIAGIMRIDEHQNGDHYRVRSVYFDDGTYSCYRENAAGVSPREKFRLRSYNCLDDVISAEIKTNYRNTVTKVSEKISRDAYDAIISNDPAKVSAVLANTDSDILKKFVSVITAKHFMPACIVDYERCAYVYPTGNVRITFDRNITASDDISRMFDPALTGRCTLFNNKHILEIKYNEFLPDEIVSLISGVGLNRESCSKYILSMNSLKQMEA